MQYKKPPSSLHAAASAAWRHQRIRVRSKQDKWHSILWRFLLLPFDLLVWFLFSFVFNPIGWVLRKAGRAFLLLAAIALMSLLQAYDPLGIYSNSDRFTATIIYQIFSPELYSSDRRERVTVILLSDNDLNEMGEAWPIEYGTHALILDEIQKLKPKSVFVDFGFLDKRDDDTIVDLQNTIRNYQSGILDGDNGSDIPGRPLMFATAEANNAIPSDGAIDEIANAAALVTAPGAFYSAFGLKYPLWNCMATERRDGTGFRPSPALAAFAATSAKSAENPSTTKAGIHNASFDLAQKIVGTEHAGEMQVCLPHDLNMRNEEKVSLPHDASHMEVIWGVVPPYRTDLGGFQCDRDQPVDHFWRRAFFALGNLFKEKNQGDTREEIGMLRQTCAPHLTIGASQFLALTPLLEAESCQAVTASNRPVSEDDQEGEISNKHGIAAENCEKALAIKAAIQGKHIIYGGNLTMAADLVLPPTHKPLPGAYFHAMALDNLLEYSSGGSAAPPAFRVAETRWFGHDASLIIEIGILLFYVGLWDIGKNHSDRKRISYLQGLRDETNNNVIYEIDYKAQHILSFIKIRNVILLSIISLFAFSTLLVFFLYFTNLAVINFTAILGILALREIPRWFAS